MQGPGKKFLITKVFLWAVFYSVHCVPDLVAFFPLNAVYGTKEINNRVAQGVPSGVSLATGPDGTADSAYEFAGTANSYIEFPNSQGGPLDVRHSMTMLCWVNHKGQDGPLFNYKTSEHWGVHLWVVAGQLFVRFTKRDYSFTNALRSTPVAGGWKFIGASYDGGSGDARLWVNGTVVQTLNIGAGLDLATQDNIRMGVKTGDGRYFKGRIAQMQVYSSALSQEQIEGIYKRIKVPDLVAFFPLDAAYGTKEIKNRVAQGVASGIWLATGPDGTANSAYEFAGTANSYIEFPNSRGRPLDVRHSMTMLCWVYYNGQDGPLFNYKTSGDWGVHLWVVAGQLFVRFTKRDYSFTNALRSTPVAGGWKFIGASYDGGSGDAKLWVNGAVVQTLNITAGLDLATQDNIRMGVKTGDWRYFKGRIAQMQVYSSALSQERIEAIYNKRIKGFQNAGCYKDTNNGAIATLEGKDLVLNGPYETRHHAIAKCAVAAVNRGFTMFAVQNGGWCASSAGAPSTYNKYGRSRRCRADGKGGPSANQVYVVKGYKAVGCFRDTSNRAIWTLEGTDGILDGNYWTRADPVAKCAVATMRLGYHMFAVQNGGECMSSYNAHDTYRKYGSSTACAGDGEGGPWANHVYVLTSSCK